MKTKIQQQKRQPSKIMVHGRIFFWGLAIFLSTGLFIERAVADVEKEPGPGKLSLVEYLQKASLADPADYALSFYLGQLYLQQGETDLAIAAWENFLSKAPAESSKTIAVKERLTVLKIASAEAFARDAVRRKTTGPMFKTPENSVAVVDFINNGGQAYTPFVKGLTAMIMTDLSKAPQLKVVEREKIQALMREMQLARLGVVDPKTSVDMGRMLMAGKITSGSMNMSEATDLAIQAMVSDTEHAKTIGNVTSKGDPKRFFELEKEIVLGLLKVLGIAEEKLDPNVRALIRKEHTKAIDALISYGNGLQYLEEKNFGPARAAFIKALEIDPNFDLAREALESTPAVLAVGQELGYDRWFLTGPVATADLRARSTAGTAPADSPAAVDSSSDVLSDKNRATPMVNSVQHAAEVKRLSHIQDLGQIPMDLNAISPQPTPQPQPGANPQPGPQPSPQPAPQPTPQPVPQPTPQPAPQATHPTSKMGFIVAAVDQITTPPSPPAPPTGPTGPPPAPVPAPTPVTSLSGVYQTLSIQDLNQNVFCNGTNSDQLTLNGGNSQVIGYLPQSGSVTSSSLPYNITFTSIGYNSYLEWGYWLGNSSVPMTNGTNTDYIIFSRSYFVQGEPTTNLQMNNLSTNNITGSYQGSAHATLWNNAGGINMNGSYSADVAFQNGRISNFNLSASDPSGHTVAISNAEGNFAGSSAVFSINANSGTWTIDTGNTITRNCRGAVYGPNAEHMGGIFSMTTASQTASGAFAGTR